MKRLLAALSAAAIVQGAAQAANTETPREFKPSSAWAADYGEDYCRLIREFSDGTERISLTFERFHPTNTARLMLMGDDIKTFRGADQLGYTFAPVGEERKAPFVRGTTTDGHQLFILGDVMLAAMPFVPPPLAAAGDAPTIPPYDRSAEEAFADGVDGVVFSSGLTKPLRLDTGNLGAPIKALQNCADDLLTYWGLDAARHQSMIRPALPAVGADKWLPTGTVGFGDFAKLAGSANQVRVMVSAEGKPTGCAIHWATLEQKTNDAICSAIMDRGQFQPALDKDGQAFASYWLASPFMLMPPPPGLGR